MRNLVSGCGNIVDKYDVKFYTVSTLRQQAEANAIVTMNTATPDWYFTFNDNVCTDAVLQARTSNLKAGRVDDCRHEAVVAVIEKDKKILAAAYTFYYDKDGEYENQGGGDEKKTRKAFYQDWCTIGIKPPIGPAWT